LPLQYGGPHSAFVKKCWFRAKGAQPMQLENLLPRQSLRDTILVDTGVIAARCGRFRT
jgi:hypothetical protein